MSVASSETNHCKDEEDDDSQDFCNLSSRSLHRPSDHYIPPPRRYHFAQRLLRDPLTTALTQFSKVTNFVLNPYDDDQLWSARFNNYSSGDRPDCSHVRGSSSNSNRREESKRKCDQVSYPPPALPPIECHDPQNRLPPLTDAEFEESFKNASQKDILRRVFKGVSWISLLMTLFTTRRGICGCKPEHYENQLARSIVFSIALVGFNLA